jgi:hypothetical protein
MKYTENMLIIAKFMGIQPMRGISEYTGNEYYYYNNVEMESYEALPFYNTWDELMPVVIKIESFDGDENELDIFGNCVQIGDEEFVSKTKIDSVFNAVVWWINKHNKTL